MVCVLITDGVSLHKYIIMVIKIKNQKNFNIQRQFGIYLIRCKTNGKIYIGSTKQSFRARFSNHCKFLTKGKLSNFILQNDFTKYGVEEFEFEILSVTLDEDNVHMLEKQFIDLLKPEYNVIKSISNNSRTNLNRKFTDEHKDKIRVKSLLFKHEDIEKITKQNKDGSNKFELVNVKTGEVLLINSRLELMDFLDVKSPNDHYGTVYKGYKIKVLKRQRKTITLTLDNEKLVFTSFEKCDKFLNKWRGYTSTQSLRNVTVLCGYSVKFNN